MSYLASQLGSGRLNNDEPQFHFLKSDSDPSTVPCVFSVGQERLVRKNQRMFLALPHGSCRHDLIILSKIFPKARENKIRDSCFTLNLLSLLEGRP